MDEFLALKEHDGSTVFVREWDISVVKEAKGGSYVVIKNGHVYYVDHNAIDIVETLEDH